MSTNPGFVFFVIWKPGLHHFLECGRVRRAGVGVESGVRDHTRGDCGTVVFCSLAVFLELDEK